MTLLPHDQSRTGARVRLTPPSRVGRGRRLLGASPAAITLVATLILSGVLHFSRGSPELTVRYERDAEQALAAGDYETARICFERLLQLRPTDPAYAQGLLASRAAAVGARPAKPPSHK
jgi:hypothetical protein